MTRSVPTAVVKAAVVSDTHGFFHPDVADHLDGVDVILHAGDVGTPDILEILAQFGPVHAVRGNVDVDAPLSVLPERLALVLGGRLVMIAHIGPFTADHAAWLRREHARERPDVFICGHSHVPRRERIDGMLHFNPGSAGHPRFGRPPSLGLLTVAGGTADARVISLRAL